MARPNLEKMSLKQLLELEARVQSAIASARERERGEVKKAMTELAEKRGFKLQELMGGRGKGKITAPKFANPEDPSQTWTGRGRKPNWLVAKLKKSEDGGLCHLAVLLASLVLVHAGQFPAGDLLPLVSELLLQFVHFLCGLILLLEKCLMRGRIIFIGKIEFRHERTSA